MLIERYFDNAATTPLDPAVLREMQPFLAQDFGNANSLHEFGRRAREAVELARGRVANLIGADDPAQIFFVSGATEANNWVVHNFATGAISPFEHSSLREPALRAGYEILQAHEYDLDPPANRPQVVSAMWVNNETGATIDLASLRGSADALHSDLTQAVGKVEFEIGKLDFASFSAHKFYGPKGVGALYARDPYLDPMVLGGEQEGGLRGGTLNVAGIVGMGAAAVMAQERMEEDRRNAQRRRGAVLDFFKKRQDVRVLTPERHSLYILSIAVQGVEGETLALELDRRGFAIAAGAACSSRSTEPSHVLKALSIGEEWIRGAVRISFGRFNDDIAATALAKCLLESADSLRRIR